MIEKGYFEWSSFAKRNGKIFPSAWSHFFFSGIAWYFGNGCMPCLEGNCEGMVRANSAGIVSGPLGRRYVCIGYCNRAV